MTNPLENFKIEYYQTSYISDVKGIHHELRCNESAHDNIIIDLDTMTLADIVREAENHFRMHENEG